MGCSFAVFGVVRLGWAGLICVAQLACGGAGLAWLGLPSVAASRFHRCRFESAPSSLIHRRACVHANATPAHSLRSATPPPFQFGNYFNFPAAYRYIWWVS